MITIQLPSIEELIEQAEAAELVLVWTSMCLKHWYRKDYHTQSLDSYDSSEEKASQFDSIVGRISVLRSWDVDNEKGSQ